MDIELFSYSLMTALLGIIIVFASLLLLSFLMIIIKKLFSKKETESTPVKFINKNLPADQSEWIIGAVAAYLTIEEEDLIPPSVNTWLPDNSEKYDPWMSEIQLNKKHSGA